MVAESEIPTDFVSPPRSRVSAVESFENCSFDVIDQLSLPTKPKDSEDFLYDKKVTTEINLSTSPG